MTQIESNRKNLYDNLLSDGYFRDETGEINFSFEDFCETKNVSKGMMYLDMNEGLEEDKHDYHFVGKVGLFTPVEEGAGGGLLLCSQDEEKYNAVTGCKGYRWLESGMVQKLNKEDSIDMSYFENLAKDAIENISQYGDFDIFVNGTIEELEESLKERKGA